MADSTIANLTSGSPAQATDALPIQRASSTLKLAVSDVLAAITSVPNGTTATTQSALSNDTKIATDAYVDAAVTAATTLQRVVVSLSSAQLLALATTPVQLVASPGAGKFINPVSVTFELVAGATPYNVTGTPEFDVGNPLDLPANPWFEINGSQFTGLMESAVNAVSQAFVLGGVGTHFVAAALDISVSGGALITGNGTLKVYVTYTVETA